MGKVPGLGTEVVATPRKILVNPKNALYLPGGKILSGSNSRDAGNTGYLDTLRAGMILGKRSNDGKYAPSILGLLTAVATPAGATLTVSTATSVEVLRRITAGGLFKVVGPPAAGVAEVQTVTIGANFTGGSFTIGYKGEFTALIAYNATVSTINTAIALLASVIADGGVTLAAGDDPASATVGVWTWTTAGPREMLCYDADLATSATTQVWVLTTLGEEAEVVKESRSVSLSTSTAGTITLAANGAVAEVQTSTIDAVMTAGTYTITYKGATTAAIAFDATIAEMQAALLLLPTVNPGDITIEAAHEPDTEVTATWTFADTLGNVPMISLDILNATGPTTIAFVETTPGEIVGAATLAVNFAIGSMIMPKDGSEEPVTVLTEETGIKVTDENGTTIDKELPRILIGGILNAANIVNYSSDGPTRQWLKDKLNENQQGQFVFNDDF